MTYQVLARKWRPKTFREMVGQEHVLKALINALDHDRLHHAYLFTGTRGVGKTTIARILAKCLNCETGVTSDPCGECSSCLEIAEGRSVDLLEVDAASRTKVEDTRELLENVQYAPTHARYKVYLIDEVHMLSTHSFNALLKTLEEPPPHVKFLLATTDPQKLPATVLSRCLQFNLKSMSPEQVAGHLSTILDRESIPFEEPALWLLGRAASGSMRDALSLTDQAIAYGSGVVNEQDVRAMLGSVDVSFVYRLLEAAGQTDTGALLDVVAQMDEHGVDFEGSLDELISLLHRVAVAQVVPDAIDNSWGDAERVAGIAAGLTAEDVQLFYQVALNGKRDLPLAVDARSGFEMVLLRMVAFRPALIIDETLSAEDLHPSAPPTAVEGGDSGKKRSERQRPPSLAAAAAMPNAQGQSTQVTSETHRVAVPPNDPVSTEQGSSKQGAPAPKEATCDTNTAGQQVLGEVPPLHSLDAAGWPQLLDRLGLTGIVYNVASHCELAASTEGTVKFVLDDTNATLFNDGHAVKLGLALENLYGQAVAVEVSMGRPSGETPAMRRERLAVERQREAERSIDDDPQVRALITRFDGELDRTSISPTDG
ncbi:MAG: DNA polymerase III subunit gamma/tau [Pseudomonadota bacterium]